MGCKLEDRFFGWEHGKKRYFYTRNVHIGMFTCLWIGSLNIDNIAIDIPIGWMDQVDQATPWMDVFCLPVIDRASTCQKLLPEANSAVSFLFDIFRTLFVQIYIYIYPSNPPISPRLFHLSMCDVFRSPPTKEYLTYCMAYCGSDFSFHGKS